MSTPWKIILIYFTDLDLVTKVISVKRYNDNTTSVKSVEPVTKNQ